MIAGTLGLDAVQLALGGGEDFELLFALPSDALPDVRRRLGDGTRVSVVGEARPVGEGIRCVRADGTAVKVEGWDHFSAPSPAQRGREGGGDT